MILDYVTTENDMWGKLLKFQNIYFGRFEGIIFIKNQCSCIVINCAWISDITCHWGVKAYPANKFVLEANNRNTRKVCEICYKLTLKTPEQRPCCSGALIVNFKNIFHIFF